VKKRDPGNRGAGGEVRAVHGKARLAHVRYLLGYTQSNTRVVARDNGPRRLRNQRKVRKTLACSKAQRYHRGMRWLAVGRDNFCRPHSSWQVKQARQVTHRRPAMAAGLTDHLWSTREWVLRPVLGAQR
jgi:hypothetical protein